MGHLHDYHDQLAQRLINRDPEAEYVLHEDVELPGLDRNLLGTLLDWWDYKRRHPDMDIFPA